MTRNIGLKTTDTSSVGRLLFSSNPSTTARLGLRRAHKAAAAAMATTAPAAAADEIMTILLAAGAEAGELDGVTEGVAVRERVALASEGRFVGDDVTDSIEALGDRDGDAEVEGVVETETLGEGESDSGDMDVVSPGDDSLRLGDSLAGSVDGTKLGDGDSVGGEDANALGDSEREDVPVVDIVGDGLTDGVTETEIEGEADVDGEGDGAIMSTLVRGMKSVKAGASWAVE